MTLNRVYELVADKIGDNLRLRYRSGTLAQMMSSIPWRIFRQHMYVRHELLADVQSGLWKAIDWSEQQQPSSPIAAV